ncbi:MAG: alpha/beta hydrolase [Candidatus Marinimicrobia bacterium]|nr:alpha/beta hydrolase [Candidatus Neomarinimicrobiota bacterium]
MNKTFDIEQYCASGCQVLDEMVSISGTVSLRVLTITPPVPAQQPEIFFVPGWISRVTSWKYALLEMTRDHKVYYVETRDKLSAVIPGKDELSVEVIASDLVFLTNHFQLIENHYIMLGSSLGGTAILHACQYLESKPLALVLIGPNAVFRVPWWGKIMIHFFPLRLYTLMKIFLKWYLRTFRLDPEADADQYEKYCQNLDDTNPYRLKRAALSLVKYEIWDILPDIDIPTLIIGAATDHLHEPGNLAKMTPLLPLGIYLDMETNTHTHSGDMVTEMRKFVDSIKNEEI